MTRHRIDVATLERLVPELADVIADRVLDRLRAAGVTLPAGKPAAEEKESSWPQEIESMDRTNTEDAGGPSSSTETGADIVAAMRAKPKPSMRSRRSARTSKGCK